MAGTGGRVPNCTVGLVWRINPEGCCGAGIGSLWSTKAGSTGAGWSSLWWLYAGRTGGSVGFS